jgi:hypothetical protein
MRAELEIVVVDEPDFDPENPSNFGVLFQLFAGPEGSGGQEQFQVVVCSPGWFASHYLGTETDICMGRHFLFVADYNRQRIESWIRSYVLNQCTGETWKEVAGKIGRLGLWEFEDYVDP